MMRFYKALSLALFLVPPFQQTSFSASDSKFTRIILSTPSAFIPLSPGKKPKTLDEKLDASNYDFKDVAQRIRGDINNDGKEELVSLSHHKKTIMDDKYESTSFSLNVYKVTRKGLKLLWSDNGSLGYGCCSDIVSGTEELVGIGNIDGSGRNHLLVSMGTSDVSYPYDILHWKGKKLETAFSLHTLEFKNETFTLDGQTFVAYGEIHGITFTNYKGRKMLKGTLWGEIRPSNKPETIKSFYEKQTDIYGFIKEEKFVIYGVGEEKASQQ